MFLAIASTLVLLFSIWPTTAIPSTSGVVVTPASSFQTTITMTLNHTLPITTAPSATAPDATITVLETVVLDPTLIHEVMAVTAGPEGPLTFIVDCPISDGRGATLTCTIVEEKTATTLSAVTTVTRDASHTSPFALPTLPSAAPKNGAARALGAAGASVLAGVVVGAMLVGAMM